MRMERFPEPELMEERQQACAYAAADFSEPHNRFIELFQEAFPGLGIEGYALDLGCGPGDIAMRFARANTACKAFTTHCWPLTRWRRSGRSWSWRALAISALSL